MDCPHQPGETLKGGEKVVLIYKDITDVFEVSLVAVPANAPCEIRHSIKSKKDLILEGIINSSLQDLKDKLFLK